ncbi:MAG: hypothetical protein RIE73_33380 [Coleofasciculus sp. C1-SOL-03]
MSSRRKASLASRFPWQDLSVRLSIHSSAIAQLRETILLFLPSRETDSLEMGYTTIEDCAIAWRTKPLVSGEIGWCQCACVRSRGWASC